MMMSQDSRGFQNQSETVADFGQRKRLADVLCEIRMGERIQGGHEVEAFKRFARWQNKIVG